MDAHNVLICFWDLNDVAIAVFPIVIYLRWCEHLFAMTIWKMAYKLISICFISFFAATQVDLVPVDAFCKSDCQWRNWLSLVAPPFPRNTQCTIVQYQPQCGRRRWRPGKHWNVLGRLEFSLTDGALRLSIIIPDC